MSTLDSLIRLHRWQVDERRRHLADLDRLRDKLELDVQHLDAEERREQAAAAASPEAGYAYASYARTLMARRERLAQSIAEVDAEIAKARDALAEAFQETKRYEIAAANRAKQARLQEARRQQGELDEIAVQAYQRREGA